MNEKRICARCHNERNFPVNRKLCGGCRTEILRLQKGDFLTPDYSEVTVGAYKQPMQKVENGFGYYGALTVTNDGEKIQCHICGYFYLNLGCHVFYKHGVNARDYRITHGLRLREGLLSPKERERAQTRYNQVTRDNAANAVLAHAALDKKRKETGWRPGGDNWSAQTRNEKGNCREQTIAKIKAFATRNDGIARSASFFTEYGSGQASVINHWFGSWSAACVAADVIDGAGAIRMARDERKNNIIEQMQDFYKTYNRTPQWSDFNTSNSLPTGPIVSKLFNGLNNARRVANIPLLVNNGGGMWIERMENNAEVRL